MLNVCTVEYFGMMSLTFSQEFGGLIYKLLYMMLFYFLYKMILNVIVMFISLCNILYYLENVIFMSYS